MASVVLTAAWGADVDAGGDKTPDDGGDGCGGFSGTGIRVANKFNITTLPTDATVTKVELTITVQSTTGDGNGWDIDGYNNDGLADPEADSGATMYARCDVAGVYVNDTTTFNTTGTKSVIDLGATAVSDVQAARAAGVIYSVAIRALADNEGANINCVFDEYTATSTKPTLTITYDPAVGGGDLTSLPMPTTLRFRGVAS